MAYKYGNRYQANMFPVSIDEYVPEEYDPCAMLKLLVYGYSYGVKSSRKLEREVNNNLTFI